MVRYGLCNSSKIPKIWSLICSILRSSVGSDTFLISNQKMSEKGHFMRFLSEGIVSCGSLREKKQKFPNSSHGITCSYCPLPTYRLAETNFCPFLMSVMVSQMPYTLSNQGNPSASWSCMPETALSKSFGLLFL